MPDEPAAESAESADEPVTREVVEGIVDAALEPFKHLLEDPAADDGADAPGEADAADRPATLRDIESAVEAAVRKASRAARASTREPATRPTPKTPEPEVKPPSASDVESSPVARPGIRARVQNALGWDHP